MRRTTESPEANSEGCPNWVKRSSVSVTQQASGRHASPSRLSLIPSSYTLCSHQHFGNLLSGSMRSGDQLLDESKRSDDEPVLVGIVQPPKRPPPPPVVLKGGKLPAIKKRRLDGSQPQAAAAAAPTKQAASQPSPSDSGMAIVSTLAKLPSTAGPSRPSPVIAVAGEQPSFGAVVRPTTALPRSKPIVAMPATDESYLSALCNPRHALHTAAAASKLQAFVPYQQPMPLRVPPPVARPIASIFLRDQASDAQTGSFARHRL